MAITAGLTKKFVQDALSLAIGSGDTVKLAFYSSSATLSPDTAAYSSTNEVTNGAAIPAGGVTLSGRAVGDGAQTVGYVDFSDLSITVTGTFTARGALMYNASRSNATIAVFDFGSDKTATDGPFNVTIPASGTGVIRYSSV